MNWNIKKSKKEVLVLVAMFLIFSVSTYCVLFDATVFGLISSDNVKNNQAVIGQIQSLSNDTRHKDSKSFSWGEAESGTKIRNGDRLFTGKQSTAHVKLNKGGELEIGENSMVNFTDVGGQPVADLSFGKVQLAVDGNIKIAINGKVQNIEGKKAKLDIFVDSKRKTHMRIVKGQAEVNSRSVEPRKVAAQDTGISPSSELEFLAPKTETIKIEPKINLTQSPPLLSYTDHLEDFYILEDQGLLLRNERRAEVPYKFKFKWATQGLVKNVEGETSNNANFVSPVEHFVSEAGVFETQKLFIGDNFWRLRASNIDWSSPQKLTLVSAALKVDPPRLVASQSEYYLLTPKMNINIGIQTKNPESQKELTDFVVELSNTPSFPLPQTQARLITKRQFPIFLTQEQDVYLRVRGLNHAKEITGYSEVLRLQIREAKMPLPPVLAENGYKLYPEQSLDVEWSKAENAQSYEVELRDANQNLIETQRLDKTTHEFKISKIGKYNVQVRSIDRFGRKSPSSQALVSIEPHLTAPPLIARKEAAPVASPVRKTSSVSSLSTTEKIENPNNLNQNFASSSVELQGGGSTTTSSQSIASSAGSPPENATIGLQVMHWLHHSGFEGLLETKVAGMTPASSEVSPVQAEARYRYRWTIPWNLFSNIQSTQISLIGGYEYYRNGTTGPFSPGYDMLKTGVGLNFPVAKRWDSGGEILVGRGFDSSSEYQLSGNLNYFMRSDWSIGVGYRVHLFEAGSNSSAPSGGIPYREGYGEAFSVLRKTY